LLTDNCSKVIALLAADSKLVNVSVESDVSPYILSAILRVGMIILLNGATKVLVVATPAANNRV